MGHHDHHDHHDHDHPDHAGHGPGGLHHHHHHGATGRLGVAFALNVSFTLVELVGAWLTQSTAIAADAVHDLGDSLSLGLAWWLARVAGRGGTARYSFGLRRVSLLGALVNAIVLVGGSVLVLQEALPRLWSPGEPHAGGMLALAVLGVVVNGTAVLRLREGGTLNERVVTWHLLEDVLGWVAVLIVAAVMLVWPLPVLDPLLSVGITLYVGVNAARSLRATMDVFLQAVPTGIELEAVRGALSGVDGVTGVRHVHVWSQDGEHHVLTAHLLVPGHPSLEEASAVRRAAAARIAALGIAHVTLEVHPDDEEVLDGCT